MTKTTSRLARSALAAGIAATALSPGIMPLRHSGAAAAAGLDPGPMSRAEAFARADRLTALGRRMFFDASLSASGRQACASCHDPAHAFGPASAAPVEMGGDHMDRSPLEMGNQNAAAVAAKLRKAAHAADIKAAFGETVFDDPQDTFDAAAEALATFEQSGPDFYPYSSRYDAFLAGKATLTAQELHGRQLFEDPQKGNCSSCHLSEPANDGEPPLFSDFGFLGLGAPRNMAIPANADPGYYDLGLCGPERTDLAGHRDYCGLFRTPTLRNVALKKSFLHNGYFHSLRDVVSFYATRDSDPGRWYPRNADGTIRRYDDLPQAYWDNLNQDLPFGRKPGDAPALTDPEIDDIVAFLGTLTDADLQPEANGQ